MSSPATGPAGRSAPVPSADDLGLEDLQRAWPAVLAKLAETGGANAGILEGTRPVGAEDDAVTIGFPADMTFNKRKAESPERREVVVTALHAVTGKLARLQFEFLDGEDAGPPADAGDAGDAGIDEKELLQRLKSEFDAEEVG